MPPRSVYVAHTHRKWFDNLSRLARPTAAGVVSLDEVHFWSPTAGKPLKQFALGEPVFFRLGAPDRKVVGYGFFATFHPSIDVHLAWELFGAKNGANTKSELAMLLMRPHDLRRPMGCTILRDAVFWPDHRWIPWGEERGYAASGIMRGRNETDPRNIHTLMGAIAADGIGPPLDLVDDFVPLEVDARRVAEANLVVREGQGTFRLRLLQAYDGRCAVTGEHTEPVLQAAHIQRYMGPQSNHVRNGLVLTQEFHTLFDRGLVTVEPPSARLGPYRLRVSDQIRERWHNGHRYYEYNGHDVHVPLDPRLRPSPAALEWHREVVFER